MNKIYYNQADVRWAKHPYTSPTHPNATIKSGGCGATSAAMIVSSFVKTIYPNQMGDILKANGLRANEGTSPNAFPWIAKKYNLNCKKTVYIKDAVECLKNGGMVVAYCKAGGLFSTGGHIIVLAGLKDNNLIVYDPYLYNGKFKNGNRKCVKVNGIEAIVSVDNFKKYCDYTLYCYTSKDEVRPSKYSAGQAVEINVKIAKTGTTEANNVVGGLDVMVDNLKGKSTSQYWVHESIIQNDTIIARAVIAFASGKDYMVQVFNRQFWIDESDIKKVL